MKQNASAGWQITLSFVVGALVGAVAGAAEYLVAFGLPDSDYNGSLQLAYLQVVLPYALMGSILGLLVFPIARRVSKNGYGNRRFIGALLVCTLGGTLGAYLCAVWILAGHPTLQNVGAPVLGLAVALTVCGLVVLMYRRFVWQPGLKGHRVVSREWLLLIVIIVALVLFLGLPPWLLREEDDSERLAVEIAETDSRPNIVFILIDTLRADHLAVYGYSRETAPTLTRLAEEGVVFENVSASSSWTKPSVATIFTSVYPAVHKARGNEDYLPASLTTLAEELRDSGYQTIGVTANPLVAPTFGFTQGFERFSSSEVISPFRASVAGRLALKLYRGIREEQLPEREAVEESKIAVATEEKAGNQSQSSTGRRWEDSRSLVRVAIQKLALVGFGERVGELPQASSITDKVLELVSEARGSGPLFLYVHYIDPHLPYTPPAPFDRVFDHKVDKPRLASGVDPLSLVKDPEQREWASAVLDLYDGEILYLDSQIDRLFEDLRVSGYLDHSIVIVTSDHGEEFLERGHTGHGKTLYQELVEVPLIMKWPSQPGNGIRRLEPIGLVDIMPTILDLVGQESRSSIQGVSFAPQSPGAAEPDTIRPQYAEVQQLEMARLGQFKIIRRLNGSALELYDLEQDPHELENLSGLNQKALGEMKEVLESLKLASGKLGEGVQGEVVNEEEEALEALRALGYVE